MRKFSLLFVLLLFVSSISFAQNTTLASYTSTKMDAAKQEKTSGAFMVLETKKIDYGTIKQGSDPYRIFKFTNEGTEPLVIKNAKGTCGCTVPTFPKEPILPGKTAEIKVRYDTKRIGKFTKTVRLTTNETKMSQHILTIKGDVKKKG